MPLGAWLVTGQMECNVSLGAAREPSLNAPWSSAEDGLRGTLGAVLRGFSPCIPFVQ